jgi:hypothetical protein
MKEFVWREAGVAIKMPGSTQIRQTASGKLNNSQEFELVSSVGNTSYKVEYADPTKPLTPPFDCNWHFDRLRQNARGRYSGKLTMERNITLNGRPGREFRIDLDVGPVLTERVFCDVGKRRVFDVGIIVPKTPDLEQQIGNFLNSFRFLDEK